MSYQESTVLKQLAPTSFPGSLILLPPASEESSSLASRGGKMRDPGNEVELAQVHNAMTLGLKDWKPQPLRSPSGMIGPGDSLHYKKDGGACPTF